MSFQQGLSGLNATSKNLEVIGNNIANANTYGAKASRAEFGDMYAASLSGAGAASAGIGVTVAAVAQQFTQGNISVSDNQMDMAINGRGFFQVGDGITPVKYSRNGQFKVVQGEGDNADKRFIADNNGLYLMGIPAGQTTPGPLSLPTGRIPAKATEKVSMELNLRSDEGPLTTPSPSTLGDLDKTGLDKTINYTTSQTLYDGKGQEVALTYHFRKLAADPAPDGVADRDSWEVFVTANGSSITSAATPPVAPSDADAVTPAFIVRFDALTGQSPDFLNPADLTLPPTASPSPLSIPGTMMPNGSITQPVGPIGIDLTGATQFKAGYGVTKLTQDGYMSGQLTDFTIESGGQITARYTNGESKPAGQVQLVQFVNPQGLQPLGGNIWASTVVSGQPTANNPGEGGNGVLQQGALEESNVDLTAELVNMITAQRIYQANAQTIKTVDQVMQTLVNLR
jgi:flagellar hook protein FlgE